MNKRRRIWLDMDSVVYDLHVAWLGAHNREYPNHHLTIEQHKHWDASKPCKDAGCPADIYSYFNLPELWTNGTIIDNADRYIAHWHDADVGFLTTTPNSLAATHKLDWLKINFPFVKDVIIVNGHLKHLVHGDILVDDGIHNLEDFEGIRILYTQPWNEGNTDFLRANQWWEIDYLVKKALALLCLGFKHEHIESLLKSEQSIGI